GAQTQDHARVEKVHEAFALHRPRSAAATLGRFTLRTTARPAIARYSVTSVVSVAATIHLIGGLTPDGDQKPSIPAAVQAMPAARSTSCPISRPGARSEPQRVMPLVLTSAKPICMPAAPAITIAVSSNGEWPHTKVRMFLP